MFKFLDKKLRVFKSIVKTMKAQGFLIEPDYTTLSAFVESNDLAYILSVGSSSILVVSSLTVESDFTLRKSYSDIVNLCYGFGVTISGLKYAGYNKNTLSLAVDISLLEPKKVNNAIASIDRCIREIRNYCNNLEMLRDGAHWDLSMFENLDIVSRSITRLAELKEFTVGSWEDMAADGFDSNDVIYALRQFEIQNRVNLSVVAEFLERELLRISDDSFTSKGSKLLN